MVSPAVCKLQIVLGTEKGKTADYSSHYLVTRPHKFDFVAPGEKFLFSKVNAAGRGNFILGSK
jgi:hypothetical protein